jgi:hypothetical protein
LTIDAMVSSRDSDLPAPNIGHCGMGNHAILRLLLEFYSSQCSKQSIVAVFVEQIRPLPLMQTSRNVTPFQTDWNCENLALGPLISHIKNLCYFFLQVSFLSGRSARKANKYDIAPPNGFSNFDRQL